jgi:hypothetical protein
VKVHAINGGFQMGLWTDAMLVMNPAQLIQIVAVQGFALAIVMATNLAKQLPERRPNTRTFI